MALEMRQQVIRDACPECGGTVVLRWSRTSSRPGAPNSGFSQARCQACDHSWYVGHYGDFPVEEIHEATGSWEETLRSLIGGCDWAPMD